MTENDVAFWVDQHTESLQLRNYQVKSWQLLWTKRASGRKRALMHLATGLGKTSVAAVDVLHYLSEEKPSGRVLFVSHMNDISRQAQRTFLRVDPAFETTFFKTGHLSMQPGVTFATFQSLYTNLDQIDPQHFSYIIWDEAHHIEAETFSDVRKHFRPEFELGLTATPERADGRDILNYFGKPLFSKSLAEGIAEGWLSPVDYHIVLDDSIKKTLSKGLELNTLKEIRELFSIRTRNEVISREVMDRRHDIGLDHAKTIVFCQNIQAAEEMAKLLGGEVYHSEINADERLDIMRRFRKGTLQVICTVDMFNEGIDIPDARLVVFLRSTSSRTIFEQQLGRGLRRHPGKDKVTVLDFVANVERINFVRELGRHIGSSLHTNAGEYGPSGSGELQPQSATEQFFGLSHFVFEDQTIELLERYETIQSIEFLKSDEVVATYRRLGTVQKTANYYGVSWTSIFKHLKKAGVVEYAHKARTLDTETIVEKYHELGSIAKTAAFFEIDTSTVRDRFRKAGVKITASNAKQYATPEMIEAFQRLGSIRKAAMELGLSRSAVRKRLINSGIDTAAKPKNPKITAEDLQTAYDQHEGDITKIVEVLGGVLAGLTYTRRSYTMAI